VLPALLLSLSRVLYLGNKRPPLALPKNLHEVYAHALLALAMCDALYPS
jgi:hypothetical protein